MFQSANSIINQIRLSMKTYVLSLLFFFIGFTVFCDENSVDSKISSATVYLKSARITRVASASIKTGQNEIIISPVSRQVNGNTLQVQVEGGATLLSTSFRQNYLRNNEKNKRIKQIRDSLDWIEKELKWISYQDAILSGEEEIIKQNNELGSEEQGVTVSELKLLSDFYRTRLTDIKKKMLNLDIKASELKETKNKLQRQLNVWNATKDEPVGEIVIQLASNAPGQVKITCAYLINNAGWYPVYDIRADNLKEPIELVYKANVYQRSGYDWKKVNLTLSTGNPGYNQTQPQLNPLYLNIIQPYVTRRAPGSRQLMEGIAMEEEAIEFDMAAPATKATTGAPPPPPVYKVETIENQVTTEYKIALKENIPSDQKPHLVSIQTHKIPAEYKYYTVPKLNKAAYLLVIMSDYGQYNLLAGNANIFFQGMYVGQTYLNPVQTDKNIKISLGIDKRVNVEREALTQFTASHTIGANRKESRGYEITVRNNKSQTITIEVVDQVPVSQTKEIEVEITDEGGASINTHYGKLTWEETIQPGDSKKFNFSFTVKYPKDKDISPF